MASVPMIACIIQLGREARERWSDAPNAWFARSLDNVADAMEGLSTQRVFRGAAVCIVIEIRELVGRGCQRLAKHAMLPPEAPQLALYEVTLREIVHSLLDRLLLLVCCHSARLRLGLRALCLEGERSAEGSSAGDQVLRSYVRGIADALELLTQPTSTPYDILPVLELLQDVALGAQLDGGTRAGVRELQAKLVTLVVGGLAGGGKGRRGKASVAIEALCGQLVARQGDASDGVGVLNDEYTCMGAHQIREAYRAGHLEGALSFSCPHANILYDCTYDAAPMCMRPCGCIMSRRAAQVCVASALEQAQLDSGDASEGSDADSGVAVVEAGGPEDDPGGPARFERNTCGAKCSTCDGVLAERPCDVHKPTLRLMQAAFEAVVAPGDEVVVGGERAGAAGAEVAGTFHDAAVMIRRVPVSVDSVNGLRQVWRAHVATCAAAAASPQVARPALAAFTIAGAGAGGSEALLVRHACGGTLAASVAAAAVDGTGAAGGLPATDAALLLLELACTCWGAFSRAGVLHRDISPLTVALDSGRVRLHGFGLSCIPTPPPGGNSSVPTLLSDLHYTPPEQMDEDEGNGCDTGDPRNGGGSGTGFSSRASASAVYGIGATVIFAATNAPPFGSTRPITIVKQLVDGTPMRVPAALPEDLKHLLRGMVAVNVADRTALKAVYLEALVVYSRLSKQAPPIYLVPSFEGVLFLESGGDVGGCGRVAREVRPDDHSNAPGTPTQGPSPHSSPMSPTRTDCSNHRPDPLPSPEPSRTLSGTYPSGLEGSTGSGAALLSFSTASELLNTLHLVVSEASVVDFVQRADGSFLVATREACQTTAAPELNGTAASRARCRGAIYLDATGAVEWIANHTGEFPVSRHCFLSNRRIVSFKPYLGCQSIGPNGASGTCGLKGVSGLTGVADTNEPGVSGSTGANREGLQLQVPHRNGERGELRFLPVSIYSPLVGMVGVTMADAKLLPARHMFLVAWQEPGCVLTLGFARRLWQVAKMVFDELGVTPMAKVLCVHTGEEVVVHNEYGAEERVEECKVALRWLSKALAE